MKEVPTKTMSALVNEPTFLLNLASRNNGFLGIRAR